LYGVKVANHVMGLAAFRIPAVLPEKAVFNMEAKLYVGNLSKSTTQEELNTLFAQAGQVTAVEVIKERKSGESKGFAFVTMSEQSDADKAVSMFNAYSLSDHELKVSPAKPREERAATGATIQQ
jgi:RNA recognition motif-containing protein